MKHTAAILLACVALARASAADDTLRHWNRYVPSFVYYTQIGQGVPIALQCARFSPKAPGYIKTVIVYLYGGQGTANILVYGHEGGSHYPILGPTGYPGAVLSQATIQKTQDGMVRAVYTLATPIYTANNQFWIGVGGMSPGIYLLSDSTHYPPTCTAGSAGGDFYRQWLFGTTGELAYGSLAYAIDVVMDYPTLTSPSYYQDVTASIGLPSDLSNGSTAFADLDKDGFLDMLAAGRLFHNNAGAAFTEITSQAGLSGSPRANAFIDIDNDGDLDILFLQDAAGKSRVYINNGDGTFQPRDLSIPDLKATSCYSIADYNNDGYPDVFVGQLWSKYDNNGPDLQPNYLLRNTANPASPDFIVEQGKCTTTVPRRSRGSQWVDFDNDGDLDLYVTNYFLEQDELYQNDGKGGFTNVIGAKGIEKIVQHNPDYYNHGTGVDWFDYDNDGDMDLLLPQFMHPNLAMNGYEGTTLYRNNGAPAFDFTDLWRQTGIEYEETHAGGAFGDVNNDGLADIMMTVYYNCRFADFYLQKPDHTFENRTFDFGLENMTSGEDAAFVDYDNDGRLDLVFGDHGQLRLFHNTMSALGNAVEIDLVSTSANRAAIGARVTVFAGGTRYMQEVSDGRGQRVGKPTRLHFGIGTAAQADSVLVRWPGKMQSETFGRLVAGSLTRLVEGSGAATAVDDVPQGPLASLHVQTDEHGSSFRYTLSSAEHVRIEIFSLLGERVATLEQGSVQPGSHAAYWDHASRDGRRVPSGAYVYTFSSGSVIRSGRLLITR